MPTKARALQIEQRSTQRSQRTPPRWIDISVPMRTGMAHWPTDPPVRIERVQDLGRGDSHTLSQISMGSHSGTHVDAPVHFIKHGKAIDGMPFDVGVGEARVLEIRDTVSIKPDELLAVDIRAGERLLLKTRNSSYAWAQAGFVEDFVYMTEAAAALLAERQVKLVGVDYLSVGGYRKNGAEVHRRLLQAGVWIVEGLDLSPVAQGFYDLICVPLRLAGGDGAPARAIVSRRSAAH